MKKTIVKVVGVIGVLVVVALAWTFILGPDGVASTVGASVAGKVDSVFDGIGLDTDLEGMYTKSFDSQGTADIVY